jgi:hypothetical protein
LLLRFHPERRRTGAATFVGRGTAAAVVIIIMRRRNEKRRSVKKIERERKERTVDVLSLSHEQTNKQMDASSSRVLRRHHKEVLGETNAFCLSISHLREEVTEEEEGKESHLLGNPNPSGSSLFEPLFPPFFAIAFIIIICVVFLLVVCWCFPLNCFLCCPLCLCGQRLTVVVL